MGFTVEGTIQEVAWFLLISALVGMLARRVRVPYVIALVVLGLVIAASHLVEVPRLEPSLMLFVFLPPLLFDAAFRLEVREVGALLGPIAILAGPGVLLTAGLVAAVVVVTLGLPWSIGLLLGSLVAATDPVAVNAVFQRSRVPRHTAVIVEAESLINDGVSITLYTAFIGIALTGVAEPRTVVQVFVWELLGGLLIGTAAGLAGSLLTRTIDDHLVEMTLSTALAYGSYLMAQSVGSSGALACVAAGFVHGSYGRRVGMSEHTRERLDDLWEYLGFLANGFVFLLIGFTVNLVTLAERLGPILLIVVVVLVARVVATLAATLVRPNERLDLSRAEQAVLVWGGLRGGLTIALALALPPEIPERNLVTTLAFGVALFTLVVQGLTLSSLIERVGLGHAK